MKTAKYFVASVLALAGLGAAAQNTYSGYFIENYLPRFQMNPAFAPDSTFKAFAPMPVLSNVNFGMRGNLHLTDVFYNIDNKTVLFTYPDISASEVMGNISDNNKLELSLKLDIANVGFRAWGGFNTVSLGVVSDTEIGVPGAFFSLAKEGVANKDYDIKNLRMTTSNYVQLGLNHSRDLSKWVPGLRAGAAVKFLFGIADFDAYFNRANIVLGEDEWHINSNADIYGSGLGIKFKSKYDEKLGRDAFDGVKLDGFKLGGFGLGFDLGAEYTWKDFRFSAAILDLGFISWSDTQYATTNGDQYFTTADYPLEVGDQGSVDALVDGLEKLYKLENRGSIGTHTKALKATLNFGIQYELPYYRNLTFGLVNSTRFNSSFTWTQFRLSANVTPVKCLGLSANLEMGTYGVGFGWLANLAVKGFNFFIGMDHTLGKLSKDGIPLNSNAAVNIGMNFPF